MAKKATAGELKTPITVQRNTGAATSNGYGTEDWANVFPDGRRLYCKWVNAYGSDVFEARQAGLDEFATLTLRYRQEITPTCRILRGADQRPYEIVSVNDVENRHVWTEIKVYRKVEAF